MSRSVAFPRMSQIAKLLATAKANPAGLDFKDLQRLLGAAGFDLARTAGSHFIYKRAGVPEILNIQPRDGRAKPYQVRQFLEIVDRYALSLG